MHAEAGPVGQVGMTPGSARPAATTQWRMDFPGNEWEMRTVRRWLESVLPPCLARDDVLTVAIELATNAVDHTRSGQGGVFRVEIIWQPKVVRVAVTDQGAPDGPRIIESSEGEEGRGLLIVRELSVRVGVRGDERGRVVWSEIAWDGPAPRPPSEDEAEPDDGAIVLARRFGVPVWIGQWTGEWWALVDEELVSALSAPELAARLARLLSPPAPAHGRHGRPGPVPPVRIT